MNTAFNTVIAASQAERRDLFLAAAARLGTAVQNVEKDFWVCWTLDALFNGLPAGGPRLLFKGGTSLSKAFGLISRFSEDIDITVFRDDLGQGVHAADLEALSGKKRRAKLDAIRAACRAYIAGVMTGQLAEIAAAVIPDAAFKLEADPDDPDRQTLLFWYPTVTATTGDYIRAAVKIEAGAKSASYILLRLPMEVEPVFLDWLNRERPSEADKIISRLRSVRDGKLSESKFGLRMRGSGELADQISALFKVARSHSGLAASLPPSRTDLFRPPRMSNGQGFLF